MNSNVSLGKMYLITNTSKIKKKINVYNKKRYKKNKMTLEKQSCNQICIWKIIWLEDKLLKTKEKTPLVRFLKLIKEALMKVSKMMLNKFTWKFFLKETLLFSISIYWEKFGTHKRIKWLLLMKTFFIDYCILWQKWVCCFYKN